LEDAAAAPVRSSADRHRHDIPAAAAAGRRTESRCVRYRSCLVHVVAVHLVCFVCHCTLGCRAAARARAPRAPVRVVCALSVPPHTFDIRTHIERRIRGCAIPIARSQINLRFRTSNLRTHTSRCRSTQTGPSASATKNHPPPGPGHHGSTAPHADEVPFAAAPGRRT
jgi:hypothetical protein